MAVGSKFSGNPTILHKSGYKVLKPISQDENRHMYFTSNPFTKKGDELVFSAVRDGQENFYLLNYVTGEYIQLTDIEKESSDHLKRIDRAHFDKERDVLFYSEPYKFHSVNIRTLEHKTVYKSQGLLHSLSVTCDGRYVVSCCTHDLTVFDNDKNEIKQEYFRMFKIDLETGEETTILYRNFPFYHLQCSPTDPDFIMYCAWGYSCTHHRIWFANIDGTKGGPLGPEMPNEHRTHEYFTTDGKHVAYHGKFSKYDDKCNFNHINHTWGIMNVDGTNDKFWNCVPRPKQAGHSIISHDGKSIAADGNGCISYVIRNDDGSATFETIVEHNSTMSGNFVHPHPSFSNDDRYIVYATDSGGADKGNIYLVDLKSKEAY